MRFTRVVGWVLLAFALYSRAETPSGVIKGLVVDEQGKPVELAHVTWVNATKGVAEVQVGIVAFAATDGQGRFLIRGLAVGTPYHVYAQKEVDDYADMALGFNNSKDDAITAIAADQDKAVDVTIRMGPKAGRLNWNVTGAATGKAPNLTFMFVRTDTGASVGGSAPADYDRLVPSNTDIEFSVSAPGYRTWYYPVGDERQRAPLRLKPGEEKTVNIQLQIER
jgi:hypothetical protein